MTASHRLYQHLLTNPLNGTVSPLNRANSGRNTGLSRLVIAGRMSKEIMGAKEGTNLRGRQFGQPPIIVISGPGASNYLSRIGEFPCTLYYTI